MSFPWLIISVEMITSPQQSSFEAHSFENKSNTLWKLYPTGCKDANQQDLTIFSTMAMPGRAHQTI
jgi:hypothetical protein